MVVIPDAGFTFLSHLYGHPTLLRSMLGDPPAGKQYLEAVWMLNYHHKPILFYQKKKKEETKGACTTFFKRIRKIPIEFQDMYMGKRVEETNPR